MRHVLSRAAEGAVAGTLGTAAMTALMRGAQATGALGQLPPRKITAAALDTLEVDRTRREEQTASMLVHFAFGAGSGALFHLLPHHRDLRRAIPEGMAFATLIWLVSYWGWVPALGIMPKPPDDRPGRPTAMVVAHWVFGAVTAALLAARRSR